MKHHASEKKHLVDKENSVKPLRNEIRLLTDSLERITRECREVKAKAEQFCTLCSALPFVYLTNDSFSCFHLHSCDYYVYAGACYCYT